eukprot:1766307-Amphidinium_carterae.2
MDGFAEPFPEAKNASVRTRPLDPRDEARANDNEQERLSLLTKPAKKVATVSSASPCPCRSNTPQL